MAVLTIKPHPKATRKAKVVGRGTGNGRGKTCGRGHKGQKARAGAVIRPGYEGGQMPLYRRLPKRGFKNPHKVVYNLVTTAMLNRFKDGEVVDYANLEAKGLIRHKNCPIKVLVNGDLTVKNLKLKVNAVSEGAKTVLEKAGCAVELV
ncbi:50S ribosomal protein L15 [Thermospira aquatica]|uniref:Large ribosomal subunit protein uL15 n=1 Tax=Thermospira aquatica TaxID=2828656 RepID=A0AAX3BA53_9SPIR|nr:50S ribosomal protein L15 [Thermospira aquatica]URA09056.1 50S ribosomal protein L15 [Thermospira aquatica]